MRRHTEHCAQRSILRLELLYRLLHVLKAQRILYLVVEIVDSAEKYRLGLAAALVARDHLLDALIEQTDKSVYILLLLVGYDVDGHSRDRDSIFLLHILPFRIACDLCLQSAHECCIISFVHFQADLFSLLYYILRRIKIPFCKKVAVRRPFCKKR